MLVAAALFAFAAVSSVSALPISLLTVQAALNLPNTSHTNASVVTYEMNGNAGACGLWDSDSAIVAGLPREEYSDLDSVSAFCGAFIVVVDPRTNLTINARVSDASTQNNTLSLSQGSFSALNGTDSALSLVSWRFANSSETALIKESLVNGTTTSIAFEVASSSSSSVAPSSTQVVAATTEAVAPVAKVAAETTTTSTVEPTTTTTSAYVAPTTTTSAYVAPTTTTTTKAYVAPTTTTTQYVAPTTTTKAYVAPVTTTKAASTSSSGTYNGKATFYTQGGAAGSCGVYNSDYTNIVAVSAAMMNSGLCGKTVQITNTANGKSVSAVVADTCPGCAYGSLDLSLSAFAAIGAYDSGVLPISWSFN